MASIMYAVYENHHHMHGNSMKRSQISSQTYSLGNALNTYNLETVGESDTRSQRTAEVCQGRPYTSETASEDSCSMRNLTGVNCDTSVEACNSAAAFFSLKSSLTTRAGRNHFRKQLKEELDKVQSMISILEARESDLRSFLQMPDVSSSKSACEPARNRWEFFEDTGFAPAGERMRILEKPRTKGGVKRALHLNADLQIPKRQRFDSDAKRMADLMRQCGTILKKLRTQKYSWVFNQPVDFVALQIPDYPMIIKQPMDLGTIKSKMEIHAYYSPLDFAADVRLTFANAMKYNPKGHDVHYMADFLLKIFEERWKNVDRKLKQLHFQCDSRMRIYDEPVETVVQSSCPMVTASATMASRGQNQQNLGVHTTTAMTYEEKQVLSEMLEEVPMEKLDQVMAIINRKDPDLKPVDGEVTIEIDRLDSDSLWELYSLLKHPKVASKAICQDSKQHGGDSVQQFFPGGGDLSHTTVGEDDGKEEDVDIGVDVPTINYAPVHIDKDAAVCSSPSSSSSSDSSSSDSDSGNSSGSDSDGEDVQSRGSELKLCAGKEPVGSGAVCEPRGSPTPKMDDAKRPLSDLDEEVSLSRPSALDEEHGQIGGVCVQEPQLQEKLHRAALLRNRFADTILKAREKTLPSAKSNATDPEKVKREREELERLQREEKARLQAEAKAAESARKKVEAAALENARRDREAQRLAARLVIQQMEKNIDIDETNDYLKDLELLGSAPVDRLPIVRDSSPSHSQEGSTFLPFNCSNPLEQLGLFMKDDDEEDEQEFVCPLQPEKVSPPNQNEEGEIDD